MFSINDDNINTTISNSLYNKLGWCFQSLKKFKRAVYAHIPCEYKGNYKWQR